MTRNSCQFNGSQLEIDCVKQMEGKKNEEEIYQKKGKEKK